MSPHPPEQPGASLGEPEVSAEAREQELREGAARFDSIEAKVVAACERSGRDRSSVVVLGACKRQPLLKLEAAYEAGLKTFAENQVQSGEANRPRMPADTSWHLIGPLQSNKVKRAAATFDTFHAVDRLKIARALSKHSDGREAPLECFLEVNLGEEESKHGFLAADLAEAAEVVAGLPNLNLVGLMAIPPKSETETEARRWFQVLRDLLPQIAAGADDPPSQLSMGMSSDFEIAIEEGATHVRIGTALFGMRDV